MIAVFSLTGCGDKGTMLVTGSDLRYENYRNDFRIQPEIANTSELTGEAVEIYVYAYDRFNDEIYNGIYDVDISLEENEKRHTGWLILDDVADDVAKIDIKVSKALFTDGTIREGNDSYLSFSFD